MKSSVPLMTSQQARVEADRCLQCFDAPCIAACPTHIDIPTFIGMITSGNVRGAAEVVKTSNPLANICGRVCPEEVFCQSVCNRAKEDTPISIRELHFYATQTEARRGYSPVVPFPRGAGKVAVIGGGPAGLGCSFMLARYGYTVTLFDKKGPGGVPKNSIPAFRLEQDVIGDDLKFLTRHLTVRREDVTAEILPALRKQFDAIYIGIGLGKDRSPGVEGEHLKGVVPVLRFLEAAKTGRRKRLVGKRVIVIGGGNVSLDAAATARRLGAGEVTLIYRRGEKEMKVWKSELEEARKQGVAIRFLMNPVEITGRRVVQGVLCRRNRLSRAKDTSGRPIPVEIRGSETLLEADMVILAIGQVIGSDLAGKFRRNGKGYIAVNRDFHTSIPGIYAGGDAISGEGTIVQSVAQGTMAARAIHTSLRRKTLRS